MTMQAYDSTHITIFAGGNDQIIQLVGLVDQAGSAIIGATITANITRTGVLPGSSVTFTDVPDQAGNYQGTLTGFNAAPGPAVMQVTGSSGGVGFGFQANVNIVPRFV